MTERGPRSAPFLTALGICAALVFTGLVALGLWQVERRVVESRNEYLEARPRDKAGALAAARLDAAEEAERLVAEAYDQVLDSLLSLSRRAA